MTERTFCLVLRETTEGSSEEGTEWDWTADLRASDIERAQSDRLLALRIVQQLRLDRVGGLK